MNREQERQEAEHRLGQMLIPEKKASGSNCASPVCASITIARTMIGTPRSKQAAVLPVTRIKRSRRPWAKGDLRSTMLSD